MTNLERMIELAGEFFAAKDDPSQLSVTEEVMERLAAIHPASLSEHVEGDGPVVWILLIPTTGALTDMFLKGMITEQQLYERTPLGGSYDVIYLCSALVLPEFRRRGLARDLAVEAVNRIRRDHPVKALVCWPFSVEGESLARAIAGATGLPLLARKSVHHEQ